MIKFPYGLMDFEKIITNGYLYVDKTHLDMKNELENQIEGNMRLHQAEFGYAQCCTINKNVSGPSEILVFTG